MLDLTIDAQPLQMELDTVASMSIISGKTWKRIVGAPELTASRIKLATCTGQGLQVLGQWIACVRYGEQEQQLPLIVIAGEGPSLFGCKWLAEFQLDWPSIHKMETPLGQILREYEELYLTGSTSKTGGQTWCSPPVL